LAWRAQYSGPMLPGDPLWTGDPTSMGLKNVRLHSQNNSAAVRFPSVALAGEDEAAHPGQTGDAAGGLLADKREVAVDDEQRGRVGGRRILDADGLRVPVAPSRGKSKMGRPVFLASVGGNSRKGMKSGIFKEPIAFSYRLLMAVGHRFEFGTLWLLSATHLVCPILERRRFCRALDHWRRREQLKAASRHRAYSPSTACYR
jgi:hypothetical protein